MKHGKVVLISFAYMAGVCSGGSQTKEGIDRVDVEEIYLARQRKLSVVPACRVKAHGSRVKHTKRK